MDNLVTKFESACAAIMPLEGNNSAMSNTNPSATLNIGQPG